MKPKIVKEIEAILGKGFELNLPKNNLDPIAGVMGIHKDYPKYALDEHGQLVGLNLAMTQLDDDQWSRITELLKRDQVRLQALNLNENKLTTFSLSSGLEQLSSLDVDDNPLELLPEEIKGKDAVLRFFKDLLKQGASELFEVKMLIVGEGETGKTTLWNLLQNRDHPVPDNSQKSTVGIQIKEGWKFIHLDRPNDQFLVNLWDFGGQDIQYMTHQFFLTRRSFYVLMADGRREVANFAYWLQIIELLGCNKAVEVPLPVLVVLNEKGNPIAKMPYDPETVKKAYPKLKIIKREVDFAKKEDGRLEAMTKTVKEILCHQIDHLPLTIPSFWNNVRQRLYSLRKTINHIDSEKYAAICEEEGISDRQQQDDLSQLLHDLGVILHFREDIHLKDFIILNPQWAVNAVYEIMKHEKVKIINQGRFDQELLQRIWTEKGYTTKEQSKLLNLMLKNNLEVCFRAREENREIFIAPQLLPEIKPVGLEWEETPETLRYIYHYPFMPKGIIGRLIVRLHENIESNDQGKVVWENGAIIEKEHCRAQVQFLDDKVQGRQIIKIEVQGEKVENRKNVLRDVRQQLEAIHRRSFPALRVFQKVPCNCDICKELSESFEHDFHQLLANREKNGDAAQSQCGKSFEGVPVKKLLEGVFTLSREQDPQGITNDYHFYLNLDPTIEEDIRDIKKGVGQIQDDTKNIKNDTQNIITRQAHQQEFLNALLVYAGKHRIKLNEIYAKVDETAGRETDLERINTILEESLDRYMAQLPTSAEIVQKWQETKTKLPHQPDGKWKFKLKLPFVFGEIEKELSWDSMAALKMIRRELGAFRKGEKTLQQLFVEDDDD